MSEDIDKLGFFDRIKVFFASLALLGGGGFLVWGPTEKLDEEFAYFREVGYGMLAFGAVFALVLITEGSGSAAGREVNFRLKSLMVMVGTGVLACATYWGVGREVVDCWKLSRGGEAAMGKVARRGYRAGYKNKRINTIQIAYAGQRKWVDGSTSVGSNYPVVYMPDDPQRMRKGYEYDGFLDMLDRGTGKWATLGLFALGLLFALWSIVKAKHFFFGRSDVARE